MNDIQIFQNPEFGEIRTVMIGNEPWFVGKDLSTTLGYKNNTSAMRNVDSDDKTVCSISTPSRGNQDMTVVNESGMYSLIFGSKLESAKKFKKWVTSEVLPSIRRTGTYSVPQTIPGQIQLLAQGQVELSERVDTIQAELESLKMDLPLLPLEAEKITEAVKRKGVMVLGGKESKAYHNRGLRQRLYNNLYSNLKYNFGVRSYRAIKRSQCEAALEIIERYQPPFFLADMIANENLQGKLEM